MKKDKNKFVLPIFALVISLCFNPRAYSASDEGQVKRIAVMNFANRSPGGQWQWLSKGLADMLITDLSQSRQLQVVERERMQVLFDEMELSAGGFVEASVCAQFARAAKVDIALFGSFLKKAENLEIEAHLIDVSTEKLTRVEWVKGKAQDLLKLEKELAFKIIENLQVPITEAEKQSIRYVPTDSLDAVEHFYKGLDRYDTGQYYEAYLQFRSALKQDKAYLQAGLWVGTIYTSLGRYYHAVVEYEDLLSRYPSHRLADELLFRLARLYDKKLALIKPALETYEKLTDEHSKSPHAVTSRYRLARLQEMTGSPPVDVYQSYQAVSKYPITAFAEGQHNLASKAFKKSQVYYVELFNQFKGSPPAVEGVTLLSPQSPTFYRNYSWQAGEDARAGSWGYYGNIKEGYIFRAADGYVFREFYVEMTRTPSEKKRSGNLSFVADIYLKSISPKYYPPSMRLAIDDTDPISVSKIISMEKQTNLVQVEVTDLFSALLSWKVTAKFAACPKISRLPGIRREGFARYTAGNDTEIEARAPSAATQGGMHHITSIQDENGIFRVAYNSVAWSRDSYGEIGTDPDIYIISSPDGKNWSEPLDLPVNSMASDLDPSLIQDSDGTFWLSWLSRRAAQENTGIWISSSPNCRSWAKPRKVDNGLPGPPERSLHIQTQTLFQDLRGEYWIIFENADLYAIHSRDGVNWSKPINITNSNISGDKKFPVAFQDKAGVYRVAWGPPSSKYHYVTMATSGDGINWQTKKIQFPAENRKSNMCFLSFMQDKAGRYLLLFFMNGLKYSVSNDCRTWSRLRKIKEPAHSESLLFQDGQGRFWLIPRVRMDEYPSLFTLTYSIE